MKWFKEKELCCKCCGQLPPFARENIEALVENVLDPLRERYGKPIVVNSGYRCAKHNREVGGATNSQHMCGEAADIRPTTNFTRSSSARLLPKGRKNYTNELKLLRQLIIESRKFDQLIVYPTFLHVSWKRRGGNRRTVLWH
jgi:hypothetical protein